jgi:hypothetical protein
MKEATTFCLTLLCLLVALASPGTLKGLPRDAVIGPRTSSDPQTDISLPDITFLEPAKSPTRTDHEGFRLRALVRSPIPLVGLSVTLNGATVHKVNFDGSFLERSRYVLDVIIPLQLGTNSIAIVASNEKTSSKPDRREVVYEPGSQSAPNLRVLAIGVSKLRSLRMGNRSASADAQAFARVMTQTQQGRLFASVETKILLDEEATREAILTGLKWLNASSESENDVRLLFLSGSLATDYIENAAYFLTSQFQPKTDFALENVRLNTFWQILESGRGNTVIFANVDWVEGGGRYSLEKFSRFGEEGDFHNYFASADGQSVVDPSWKHSAFTTALLEGLEGKADIVTQDGIIDTHELQSWIRLRVEELTGGKQLASIEVGRRRLPVFKLSNPR